VFRKAKNKGTHGQPNVSPMKKNTSITSIKISQIFQHVTCLTCTM